MALIESEAVCVGNPNECSLETTYVFKFVLVKSGEVSVDCYPVLIHIMPLGSPCNIHNHARHL